MADRSMQVDVSCPEDGCDNTVIITKRWTVGGINDYGGYILECEKCHVPFGYYLGRDIDESQVVSGGKVVKLLDRDECEKLGLAPSGSN